MNNLETLTPTASTPVQTTFFKTGYCTHPEAVTLRGAPWKNVQFPALFVLIQHPTHGNILYDTGYASRFFEETKRFPNRIYALITPVFFQPEQSAVEQLQQQGIAPNDISYIVVSHFHADHIGGLIDFPKAIFLCTRSAYDAVKNKQGISALKAGFLPGLLPTDFAVRAQFVDDSPTVPLFPSLFDTAWDIFNDGSLLAVELPGHATGQLGLIFTDTQAQAHFLVADACWSSQAYQELTEPLAIAQLIFANPTEYRTTLQKLHQLHQQRPDLHIIPTHCGELWQD